VAAHLRHKGVDVRVFGEPMEAWRGMPAGMLLKSAPDASNLSTPVPGYTLADYFRLAGLGAPRADHPVPLDVFVRYGMWFKEQLVPDVEQVRVTGVEHEPAGFRLSLATGEEVRAATVVVATGLAGFAHIPDELADGSVSHSSDHADLTPFRGHEVLVVGAGQSAIESAVLLHETGARVRLVARRSVVIADPPRFDDGQRASSIVRPWSPLGDGYRLYALSRFPGAFRLLPDGRRLKVVRTVLGPLGSWWLKDRLVDDIQVHEGLRLRASRFDSGRTVVEVADSHGRTRTFTADHVIAATGYRADLDRLGILGPHLRGSLPRLGGWPRLNGSFQSSVPGLFFVGYNAAGTFGSVQRFVCGAGYAARRVARAIAVDTRTGALASAAG
jgi:cation diffusion facilitator CzcD-associated flavoprotein CzcO